MAIGVLGCKLIDTKVEEQTTCRATKYDVSISTKVLVYSVKDPPPVRFEFLGLNNRFGGR
jgi:hypothetical protein